MSVKESICTGCLLLSLSLAAIAADDQAAPDFVGFLKPLVAEKCVRCHGGEEVSGEVNLAEIASAKQLLDRPDLVKEMIDVVDAHDMPPEDEPQLNEQQRTRLLANLKTVLREATSTRAAHRVPIRRLNRFQYNNSVKDLFQLKLDVFELPEKLMTRYGNYLVAGSNRMPDRVQVASLSLNPTPGLQAVNAFPQDLRASHGFDNQANQLTLSPLLLDSFLRLSVSIVESPDFNEQNVGIWNDFFREPAAGYDKQAEIRARLGPFLETAFRGPVDRETLDRYTAYALSKMDQGLSFTDTMKKVASAVLSSPMFLYRSDSADGKPDPFELASNLSFFLWGSCPDRELLRLAESGELSRPEQLHRTIERMMADPKIERFLDMFPAQWMQLENVLAATPDPETYRFFTLDKSHPASLQMVLEPLLLFDAVFIENRPIVELVSPTFSYQSDFLKTWYTADLQPPPVDTRQIVEENRRHDEQRKSLEAAIQTTQAELDALLEPVRARLLAARSENAGETRPVDLKPWAAWEFDGDLKSSVNSVDLQAHGDVEFQDGMVVLDQAYLQSGNLPIELKAKTLEVWCTVPDVNQRGGGVMAIQGPGDFFDAIVLGERKPQHWISGSNGFSRTEDFPESTPETDSHHMLHLAMVYQEDGTTALYRNGHPYGKPYRKGSATFPKGKTSILFGLRHLPPGGNKYLSVSLDKARLYDRALTAEEVAASNSGHSLYISAEALRQALTPEQKAKREALSKALEQSQAAVQRVPAPRDPRKLQQDAQRRFDDEIRNKMRSQIFERVAAADPRFGGVITNAAMLSMTSGPQRTKPIARGAWVIEVIFNDPPPPPPNNVPPLDEDAVKKDMTIREVFAQHRENPTCAACHERIDPLGFALENFDVVGQWRDKYDNGRAVDASGTLMKKYPFDDVVDFKQALVREERRFAKAFAGHMLRFALSRELTAADSITVDEIVEKTEADDFKLRSIIKEVILSRDFAGIP